MRAVSLAGGGFACPIHLILFSVLLMIIMATFSNLLLLILSHPTCLADVVEVRYAYIEDEDEGYEEKYAEIRDIPEMQRHSRLSGDRAGPNRRPHAV